MHFNSFSVRTGARQIEVAAPNTINRTIVTSLWNLLHEYVLDLTDNDWLVKLVYVYLHLPVDTVPHRHYNRITAIKTLILADDRPWDYHYDLFEIIMFRFRFGDTTGDGTRAVIAKICNSELARAGSPYRFVDYRLVELTSEEQIEEINAAANVPDKFHGAREHVTAAIKALSHKPNPEYRNCIEESIHSVESALKVATGVTTGGIKKALRSFCNDHSIHRALEQSIEKLYGYSSNKQGLRHPLLNEKDNLTGADARLMLITASALVNWIVAKDAGLTT